MVETTEPNLNLEIIAMLHTSAHLQNMDSPERIYSYFMDIWVLDLCSYRAQGF